MGLLLLNYSFLNLFINYDAHHSPLLLYGTNQKVALFNSHFSHFVSPILYSSKFFNIDHVLFSNVLNTPIKIRNAHSSFEDKLFTSTLSIESAPNKISTIKKCYFNNTSSRNGNGAIDFNVYLVNVLVDDCTFYKCSSVEQNGAFGIEFSNVYSDEHDSIYSINVTNCCFYNCSTNQENQASSLLSISSDFTSLSYSSLLFQQNLVYQNGMIDLNGYISKAYLVTSKSTNKLEASCNNFTKNEGNLFSLKASSSFNPLISETTIFNNTCKPLSTFFNFLSSTSPSIRNVNIVSNNFTRSAIFTSQGSVKVENAYFLKNDFQNLIIKYEEHYFGFKNCIFDFTPQIPNLDDSNIIIEEGKDTETISVQQKNEELCYVYSSAIKKPSKSTWVTVGVFMCCGIAANIIIVVTLIIYLRRRKGQKFLSIAEVPSGYDKIYDADV